jgi:hypothetical protein
MKRILLYSFSMLFLLVWLYNLFRAHEASFWETTVGKILSSRVESDGDGYWFPMISFEYHVRGVRYVSTRIYPGNFRIGVLATRFISNFVEDSVVAVYYDPLRPSDAVLVKRLPWLLHLSMLVVVVFCSLAAYFNWFSR